MKTMLDTAQQSLDQADAERFRFWFSQRDMGGTVDFWRNLIDVDRMSLRATQEATNESL